MLIALALSISFLSITGTEVDSHQNAEKVLRLVDVNPKDPVKLVSFSVDDNQISSGEPFQGTSDWLKTTRIQLKNVSNKNIIFIELRFFFPETLSSGNEMMYTAHVGNKPGLPVANEPFFLKPNDEFTFSISAEEYRRGLVRFVASRTDIAKISRVNLSLGFVVFDDLLAYQTGIDFKQDPANLRRWLPVKN
jgi:hypothetical protein